MLVCFCSKSILWNLKYETIKYKNGRTPNLPTNIVDFRGFDSSIILIQRGGIPRPIWDFLESSTQAMLVGVMLVGRLGVILRLNVLS